MTTREVVHQYLGKGLDRNMLIAMVMDETGSTKKTVQNILSQVKVKGPFKSTRKKEILGAQTVEEYGKPFDLPEKVMEALDVLRNSSKNVCADVPFRKFCGISDTNWKTLKTTKKLAKYHRKMPNGQLLWGDPDELNLAERKARHIYE